MQLKICKKVTQGLHTYTVQNSRNGSVTYFFFIVHKSKRNCSQLGRKESTMFYLSQVKKGFVISFVLPTVLMRCSIRFAQNKTVAVRITLSKSGAGVNAQPYLLLHFYCGKSKVLSFFNPALGDGEA